MLIRVNVGSSLNPKEIKIDDATLLKDVVTNKPTDSTLSLNGVNVDASALSKSLKDLGVTDGAHILYSSKQKSGLVA